MNRLCEITSAINRRRLLAAAALAPIAGRSRAEEPGPIMLVLSDYMAGAPARPLPPEVVEKAKHHVLDTFGAMISGSQLAPGKLAIAFAASYGGRPLASVVASKVRCGPIEAALANAVLAHSDETDDSHAASASHPGSNVVPAALALGEQFGISGPHFLRAVTLGYDVGSRVTIAMGGVAFRAESHRSTHSIAGLFAAAAAAGAAASLDSQRMRFLLDYTAQQSSGVAAWQRDTDHVEKAFVFAGMGARSGVTAALLVKAGWTGIEDIFSGPDNFFQAFAPKVEPERLVEGLGARYEVAAADIKKWTVGSPIQGPLDGLQALMLEERFKAADVREVVVRLAPTVGSVVDDRAMPDISLQHMMAVMLLNGTASFAAAHDKPAMADPAILAEKAKVRLVADPELARRLPARHTVVEVALKDGRRFSRRVEAVRGTAANPMTRKEVVEKVRDLSAPVLGLSAADRLIDAVLTLETLTDIRALRPLLQTG